MVGRPIEVAPIRDDQPKSFAYDDRAEPTEAHETAVVGRSTGTRGRRAAPIQGIEILDLVRGAAPGGHYPMPGTINGVVQLRFHTSHMRGCDPVDGLDDVPRMRLV